MAKPPLMASDVRTIFVLPRCGVGEFVCQDEMSCSTDGVCVGDSSARGNSQDPEDLEHSVELKLTGPTTMPVKQARSPQIPSPSVDHANCHGIPAKKDVDSENEQGLPCTDPNTAFSTNTRCSASCHESSMFRWPPNQCFMLP